MLAGVRYFSDTVHETEHRLLIYSNMTLVIVYALSPDLLPTACLGKTLQLMSPSLMRGIRCSGGWRARSEYASLQCLNHLRVISQLSNPEPSCSGTTAIQSMVRACGLYTHHSVAPIVPIQCLSSAVLSPLLRSGSSCIVPIVR